jgi:hypothetical protein
VRTKTGSQTIVTLGPSLIIAGSVDPSKRIYIKPESGGATTAKAVWIALKARHENEGPIRQVNLLQKALATKYTKEAPLPETGRQICGYIKRAFTIGILNQDLLLYRAYERARGFSPLAHRRVHQPHQFENWFLHVRKHTPLT